MEIVENIVQAYIDSLQPYERNARTHPAEQIKQIEKAIAEFGFLVPIIINHDGVIISGHGRVEAASNLGMESVPAIYAEHLSEDQIKAFVIADNKIPQGAGWDTDLLVAELSDLKGIGTLELTGFTDKDFERLSGGDKKPKSTQSDADEYSVIINCTSEHEQQKLYDEFDDRGLDVKML